MLIARGARFISEPLGTHVHKQILDLMIFLDFNGMAVIVGDCFAFYSAYLIHARPIQL